MVSECIIHIFEIVQIDKKYRRCFFMSVRIQDNLLYTIHHQFAIGQIRQHIEVGEIIQLLLRPVDFLEFTRIVQHQRQ